MLKASHCIAIALAFLVAASLRASAGERPVGRHDANVTASANAQQDHAPARLSVPWRLVFR